MLYPYRESVLSQLYPGHQHSTHCLRPAVECFEQRLDLPENHRNKIVWRLDGGFGADKHIDYLVGRGYHVLVKGASHLRAAKLARRVQRWQPLRPDRMVGAVETPESFCKPVQTFVLRHWTEKGWKHSYLYSSLGYSGKQTARLYDGRGGAETDIRADKSGGLHLDRRRKHKRDAQEAWVLLTDMVHNYLSWFRWTILCESSRLSGYGPLRISRDLLRIPGQVELEKGRLLSVSFLKSVPDAAELLACMKRLGA